MNPARPSNSQKLLTLQEAATILEVSVDVLLDWNEHNILKPTITQSGEIGYSQEQIDQFAIIRRFDDANTSQSLPAKAYEPIYSQNVSVAQNDFNSPTVATPIPPQTTPISQNPAPNHVISDPGESFSTSKTIRRLPKISSTLVISSFMVVICLVFVSTLLIEQGNFKSLISEHLNTTSQKVSDLKSSNLPVAERIIVALPIQLNSDKTDDSSIKGETVSKDKIRELTTLYGSDQPGTNSANQPSQVLAATAKERVAQYAASISSESALYKRAADAATVTTYASSTSCTDCVSGNSSANSTIDDKGNIIGDAGKNGSLATTLGSVGSYSGENSGFTTGSGSSNLLIFLSISVLGGIFVLQKQLTSTMKNLQFVHAAPSPINSTIDFVAQKILEVEQKMDGTVVMIFQGAEYKICKPELYSESDRFIERLMALSGTLVKEMDYDIRKDGKLKLTSPLSRLVTRLGFVGIRRELFFPRTSKERVLFRKYLTRDDLRVMGLTPEQVAIELFHTPLQDVS